MIINFEVNENICSKKKSVQAEQWIKVGLFNRVTQSQG